MTNLKSSDDVAILFVTNWDKYTNFIYKHYPYMDEMDIEDMIAQCREKVLRYYHIYDESRTQLDTWVIQILINIIKTKYIRLNTQKRTDHDTAKIEYVQFSSTDNTPLIKRIEYKDQINCIFSSKVLTDADKLLLNQLVEGYTYEELVEYYNKPMNTVKSNIFKARQKCKKLFKTQIK